jgi:nucleotide-binding universal stress UspA family protein
MFKKILFATSASPACDHAARQAFDLAKRYDAELIVLHVFATPTREFSLMASDLHTGEDVQVDDDYRESVLADVEAYYENQLKEIPKAKVSVVVGYPHRETLRVARAEDVDLIVMGASTQRERDEIKLRRDFPGSTVQRVAKAARCPVLTVSRASASMWGGFSNIVFGTDFSRASDAAFAFALKMAKEFDCSLKIFHTVDISGVHAGKMLDQEAIEDKIIAARNSIRTKYVQKMEGFKDYDIDVWEGVPYIEIVKYTREQMADLVVMAHHSANRGPDEAELYGSTMEQVIMRAPCPVISVNKMDKV